MQPAHPALLSCDVNSLQVAVVVLDNNIDFSHAAAAYTGGLLFLCDSCEWAQIRELVRLLAN